MGVTRERRKKAQQAMMAISNTKAGARNVVNAAKSRLSGKGKSRKKKQTMIPTEFIKGWKG